MPLDIIRQFDLNTWTPAASPVPEGCESLLESGNVLYFPQLAFDFGPGNADLISRDKADGKAKNISYRGEDQPLRGAQGSPDDLRRMKEVIGRYATSAESLVKALFPHYAGNLKRGFTSFRTARVEDRKSSWRKDDTRLHVDAFPSNPTAGKRLLRVFNNVNPDGVPRVWRVGEPFADHAARFMPKAPRPVPGSAAVMRALRITKARRTEYDHYMNQLHDLGKADLDYQKNSPQVTMPFPPGATWVVYSDQVLHGVMSGQFMMEQTFYLEPEHLKCPETSPLRVLETMTGRKLV